MKSTKVICMGKTHMKLSARASEIS